MAARRMIVTLDGPAGVGKTTIARQLAEALGLAYLDTGAMFRAVAWRLGEEARELDDETLKARLAGLAFSLSGVGRASEVRLDGASLPDDIRTEKVGLLASTLATLPLLRESLKAAQQAIGASTSLVVEGRDMGTVVFPDAACKFFLDASPEERARRRYLQLRAMGKPADLADITLQLKIRDAQDRNRAIAPLKPAPDATVIDTSALSVDEVFAAIMADIRARSKA
jgi:cytidylate kinase